MLKSIFFPSVEQLQRLIGARRLLILTLISGSLLTTCGGIVYSFSLYGPQLATRLGYTSLQTNLIAIAGNLGVFVSTPYFGYLVDREKPAKVALMACVLYFLGFMMMALTYEGLLPGSFFLMMFYYFMVGMAGGCSYITATSTTGHNFKNKRGFGIGVPVTFFGLSAFLYSLVFHQFFVKGEETNTLGYLRFMGLSTFLITLVASRFLVKVDYEVMPEEARPCSPSLDDPLETQLTSASVDIGGWDLFYDLDARLLFISILIIGGSGLMYINNVGTMLHTLQLIGQVDNLPALQALNVSVFSILNCLSRLIFATTSDYLASHFRFKRSYFLLASALILSLSQFLSGFVKGDQIVISSAVMGIGYGFMFAVAPTLTSIWFGTLNFGTNWGWINIGPALGGQLFSLMFGLIYDAHLPTEKGDDDGPEVLCKLGQICYQSSFFITTMTNLVAALFVFVLLKRRAAVSL